MSYDRRLKRLEQLRLKDFELVVIEKIEEDLYKEIDTGIEYTKKEVEELLKMTKPEFKQASIINKQDLIDKYLTD